MGTLDTEEGQKKFAERMLSLVAEFGGDCATWIVSDKNAVPMSFGVVGTSSMGARELLCRAISISYDCDMGKVSYLGGGVHMANSYN